MAKRKKDGDAAGPESYALRAGLQVARLGKRRYAYQGGRAFPVTIPTAEITPALFEFLQGVPLDRRAGTDQSDSAAFDARKRRSLFKEALRRGYLVQTNPTVGSPNPTGPRREFVLGHENLFDHEFTRFYQEPTFFGVPSDFPSHEADVGILGVPVAFDKLTLNTRQGYHLLRESSCFSSFDWFEIYREGLFTDINLDGMPAEIGKGVVLKDFGFVDQYGKTLGAVLKEISRRVSGIMKNRVKPLFIGGDHAVTFPVLSAMTRADPELEKNLVIVHLDAHDDLFFNVDGLTYSHATPFLNILETTRIQKLLTFGLRAAMTHPAHDTYRHVVGKHFQAGRVAHYGISKTLELIADPRELKALFPKNAKIYVSIDVDCLSESLIGRAVNAPCVDGLHWKDVFALLGQLSGIGEVVGADIVEFCHNGGNFCMGEPKGVLHHMHLLLLYLIHILADKKS
jgi:arginase family enzyme